MVKFNLRYFLILSAAILTNSCTNDIPPQQILINGQTMGTTYSVKITDSLYNELSVEKLKMQIDSVLIKINQQMSTYIEDSEISLFNKSESTDWQSVSYDFAYVSNASKIIGLETSGASDITIGPLVNLWGFGPNYIPEKIPSEEAINKAKSIIGLDKIHIKLDPPQIKKDIRDIYCDLSSTAKGYGVDKVSNYLEQIGINNYLVEIGGEVRAKGTNHTLNPWKIGISTPDASGQLQLAIELKNKSMATSGDYWNYYEEGGVRYSHLIDPQTGKPISHNLASVTVLHKSCLYADGYATAINIMGPEKGLEFAESKNLAVFMIVRDINEYRTIKSTRFKELIKI